MRTKNSIKNTMAAILTNIFTIIIGFISQAIFIKILGTEFLGINGLFTNIISMLGIVELGIGSAITYNLYKPIEDDDKETIKSLMIFYKRAYHIIALIVLIFGLLLLPFLNLFIKEVSININIHIIFILFIIDIVCSYLLSYKRSILYANQKNYIINIIHILYLLTLNISQLILLYYTKNYYLYLIIKIVFRILENIIISSIANKIYPYLKEGTTYPLSKDIRKDIIKKVKALFFHKIGAFVVLGTDNIIISKYLGLVTVGLYSNYYMIINSVNSLFSQIITALTPSIGSMLVTDSKEKCFSIFKKVRFLNFWISCFSGIAILVIMQPFIKIWIGKEYLLPNIVLYILVLNFYQKMMRSSYSTFKEAAGIYYEDRYVPLIESLLNITFSIIFVYLFGLAGVFIGTIVSGLVLWCYSYPKYVYKKLFNRNYLDYAKETVSYIILFIITATLTYLLSSLININSIFIQVCLNLLISIIIPNFILLLIFHKTDNFKYYLQLSKKILKNNKKTS